MRRIPAFGSVAGVEYPVPPATRYDVPPPQRAEGEIADVAEVLQKRAAEFGLDFLAHVLAMAAIEARDIEEGRRAPAAPA
jgi:hypothetical protein